MNEHNLAEKEDAFKLIREVGENPSLNQRLLSRRLNISLGKTNYLLRKLAQKGIIKIVNFSKKPDKAKKLQYILTQKGMEEQMALTVHFLKAKEKEYRRLKEDYERQTSNRVQ